ncbi:helix-turn-helix domain-containing protein [Mobiluncus curtisii]|uniref:helix-turn-helix domain-containing protein n=1 Tax=Mobiluncus curtisii TaxID=2051 RepID=UPI0014701238|nr:helix-turn-helix domain-containing protein [Mobiluncus curtisii]NMX06020.1 helix-turn-helix domain-containing protein [Mobiluncus curtisii]
MQPTKSTQETVVEPRKLYSLKETAQMLGISYRAIQDWQYANRIKTVKLGRRVMVPAVELDRIAVEGVK